MALSGVLALGGHGLIAQQVFRATTDLVLLNVTVNDTKGQAIVGLSQDEFQVLEDGIPQQVSLFARDPQPIALSVLIDSSTSMDHKLRVAEEAAVGFVRRLRPGDVAQVVTFNKETQIRQPFTGDIAALEAAIRRIRAGGSTSLYTAVYIALDELAKIRRTQPPDEIRRQAILMLSDGEDTTSLLNYEVVLDLAKRSDVIIYAIGLRDRTRSEDRGFNEFDYVLRTLAQSTGGRAVFIQDIGELIGVYTQIADELANQYTLGYQSRNQKRDGAWRQVSVRVARPNVSARTRAGYYAPHGVR
jgi:Ca-activated chloride channel family protein